MTFMEHIFGCFHDWEYRGMWLLPTHQIKVCKKCGKEKIEAII